MDQSSGPKRKAESSEAGNNAKRSKGGKKQWKVTHKESGVSGAERRPHLPEVGDAGIWVTCDMNREAKAISELRPLLEEHAARLYDLEDDTARPSAGDIGSELAQELAGLRDSKKKLFQSIRIDTQCLLFFKTIAPVEPTSFVLSYCQRAQSQADRKETRCVRKLTPITSTGKANEKGVDDVAKAVLSPHFHGDVKGRKFAIRVNLRNHTTMKRDQIIKQVAEIVGPDHPVDLTNYDLLILIEVYQTIVGMSVVGPDYDALKKYNLAEIYARNN